jgi:hypothetical protein
MCVQFLICMIVVVFIDAQVRTASGELNQGVELFVCSSSLPSQLLRVIQAVFMRYTGRTLGAEPEGHSNEDVDVSTERKLVRAGLLDMSSQASIGCVSLSSGFVG